MESPAENPITQLLDAVGRGDGSAHERLWSAIYEELRELAHRQMAHEAPGRTLQPTALVNEAYMRLFGKQSASFDNRRHFFAAAAEAMRRIRIDEARKRMRRKRSGQQREPLDDAAVAFDQDPVEVLAVDEALSGLRKIDSRKADVVNLRYFAGLTVDETASALGVSPRTVDMEWRTARAWLHRELSDGSSKAGNSDGEL